VGQEGDDRLSLPVPPPPNPAARRTAIDAAMRKFDGLEPPPPPRRSFSFAHWARTHRVAAGGLVTATLIAIVSIPAIRVAIQDHPAEVATEDRLPAVQNEPVADNAVADSVAAEQPAAPAVQPPVSQPGPAPQAVPVVTTNAQEFAPARREEKAGFAAQAPAVMAPPPAPPPPPPPAAGPEAQAAQGRDIIVTGSRVRQQNLESLSPISVVSSDEIGDSYGTFLSRLQDKLGARDKRAVLRMVGLPLHVRVGGETRTYRTRQDIERDYDRIFTRRVEDALIATYSDQLQARDGGKLKGNGSIWFGCGLRVCESAETIRIREVSP